MNFWTDHPDIIPPRPQWPGEVLHTEHGCAYVRMGNDVRLCQRGRRPEFYCQFRNWEQSRAYWRKMNPLPTQRAASADYPDAGL